MKIITAITKILDKSETRIKMNMQLNAIIITIIKITK